MIIDINDTKHRYYIGRDSTLEEKSKAFGVSFKVVGKYYPNRAMATDAVPPLQLEITGDPESVQHAATWVKTVIEKGPPPPVKAQKKLYLPFDHPETHLFAIRNAVLGPQGGTYLRYLTAMTGCGVSLRGRGSGAVLTAEDREEKFHLLLTGSNEEMLGRGVELAEDLLAVIDFEYEVSKDLGYFTPLGGMFAPDHLMKEISVTGKIPQNALPTTTNAGLNNAFAFQTTSNIIKKNLF